MPTAEPTSDIRAAAWKYLPEPQRVLAVACHDIAQALLIPDGWSIVARGMFLTAFDEYGLIAVQIRPSDVTPGGWYGTVDVPGVPPAEGPSAVVNGGGPVNTFRNAVGHYIAICAARDSAHA